MAFALAALLLAAASGQSVADAERAFAADAQTDGQWEAFRATAAPDAIMYAPGPVNAQALLAHLPTPTARLNWHPAHTITSCDGTLAFSTGPWSSSSGSGRFATIWRRDAAGWRWIYDGGHIGGASAGDLVEDMAACPGPVGSGGGPSDAMAAGTTPTARMRTGALAGLIEASDGPMPIAMFLGVETAEGASTDRTLRWRISPVHGVDYRTNLEGHLLRVWSWDGRRYRLAVLDYSVDR